MSDSKSKDKVRKSDAEWREQLSREQFDVTRRKGTERAFKFFGFLFLGIGLTMIALIVYSMLFHYR